MARQMEERGYIVYCPLAKRTRQWSDRVKIVEDPVFRGYVFVYVSLEKLWQTLKIAGVIYPVRDSGKPAVIRDDEIETIKRFLNEFKDVTVENIALEEKDRVKIKQGIMMDYEGIVLEVHGRTAVVKIRSLGLQLKTLIDKKNLEKLD